MLTGVFALCYPVWMTTEIRPAQNQDREALADLYLSVRQKTFYWIAPENLHHEDFAKDTAGEHILVAVQQKIPIGFISLWMADNFIHHLFIAPSTQSHGVGTKLLCTGLNLIGRPARLKCLAQNTKACSFYENLGWRIESTTDDPTTGPYHTYVLNR